MLVPAKRIPSRSVSFALTVTLTVAFGVSLLLFPSSVADAISEALAVCGTVLIPTLFPFMVFSVFIVRSGLSEKLGRFFEPVTRFLFRLPGCAAATVLTGLLGGYPAGARGIRALVETGQITPREAERMTRFCLCAGPAFVISAVGARMLGAASVGVKLYAAQLLTALFIGTIGGLFAKKETKKNAPPAKQKPPPFSTALLVSVDDAVRAMLMMCALTCVCGALSAILSDTGVTGMFTRLLDAVGLQNISASIPRLLLEVADGCQAASHANSAPVFLCALALGWGGLCVHLQIFSTLNGLSFPKGRFFLFRVLQTALSAAITWLLFVLFPSDAAEAVFSTFRQAPKMETGQNGIGACLALVLMSVIFLFSTSTKNVDFFAKKWYHKSE